jgi:membrane protease YdiL (CAAX protease family)
MDSSDRSPAPPLPVEPESLDANAADHSGELSTPAPEPQSPSRAASTDLRSRSIALLEILICSDYPTQFALAATFAAFGFTPAADGTLSLAYIVALSLIDTVFLVGLILMFLQAHGESARELFFGPRPIGDEARRGFALIFVALLLAAAVMLTLQQLLPSLHNVEHNPLQDMVKTPGETALFALVAVIAGGVREELQRAFILRRFEQHLGGPVIGVIVASIAFGAGHYVQGADATVATAFLGAFWAIVYLRRRSVVAPMVSHSGFNLFEIVLFVASPR